jgi:hypothetical protein
MMMTIQTAEVNYSVHDNLRTMTSSAQTTDEFQ